MRTHPIITVVLGCSMFVALCGASAERQRNGNRQSQPAADSKLDAPAAQGKVVVYEAGKSITLETASRNGAKRFEFLIDANQSKIELPPRMREITLGNVLSVWTDKDNPQLAIRIAASGRAAQMPNNRRPNRRPNPMAMRPTPADSAPKNPPISIEPRLPVAGLDSAEIARQIDAHIEARLKGENLSPAPLCDDAEFLRRVHLDIAGVIPTADAAAAFLGSSDSDKRAKLIDELLAGAEYGRHFADLWCDRINMKDLPVNREPFVNWLAACFNANRGWNEIVVEMLTAEGQFNVITRGKRLGSVDPRALLVLLNTEDGVGKGPNPAWLAGESGRLFLGVQLQCAECHDHPFTETWKQTDFWGFAAFFSRLESQNQQPNGRHWVERPALENVSIAIPETALKNVGQTVPARLLGAEADYHLSEQEILRQSLARWITAKDNAYFAKAMANRMWAHLFGRGLVNPVDDLRPDNPPTHPELLELLAGELNRSEFDLKHLIRCLCLTNAYQRTSISPEENGRESSNYDRMPVKMLPPGVLYDSLKRATGWPELKLGLPERKTKLTVLTTFTPREIFVDFFRSSQGMEADPLQNDHGIPQALKLMNAYQLNQLAPIVQQIAESASGPEDAIERLYLTALARRPSSDEVSLIESHLTKHRDVPMEQNYNAVLWVLINTAEFIGNH